MSEQLICRHEKCDKPAESHGVWCQAHRITLLSQWMRLKAMREVL